MKHRAQASTVLLLLTLALGLPHAASADRGRPLVTTTPPLSGITYATLVSNTGSLLRGPRWSTDLQPNCEIPTRTQISNLRFYGFNALHLYAEAFSVNRPAGYCQASIDTLVEWTGQDGLYLILTIGNGNANGTYDRTFATNFWNLYAPRYKDRTHVVYEIQNEPYFNGVTSQPSPTHLITFEKDMYNLIRSHAPNTPILLFSYAVFKSGSAVMQDVQALGNAVNWSNAAIAFHGYATLAETESTLQTVVGNNIPCVQTEFYLHTENGQPVYKQDVAQTIVYEDRFTSWLSFLDVVAVYDDTKYRTPLDQAWVIWAADYGTWPAKAEPPVGRIVSLQMDVNGGKWVSAVNNGVDPLKASASTIGTAEKFEVVASGDGTFVYLKALVNGKFVTAENAGAGFLIANRTQVALWEKFEWLKRPNGTVALRARVNNKIVSADLNLMNPPQLIASRKVAGPWETILNVTLH
jgi:hypothetical protein